MADIPVLAGKVLQLAACNLHLFKRLACYALKAQITFPKNNTAGVRVDR
jgi:hypothetical protein